MGKNPNLATSTKRGFVWSLIENLSLHTTRFLIGIIMARILTPTDYGMVGMLIVFMVFSDILINSGIGAALNRMQAPTSKDFSTAFLFNFGVAVIMYVILFLSAPFIADFYSIQILCPLLRVTALSLLINSIGLVPITILQIKLCFKTISIITITASLLSGVSGLFLAYNGYGVWALVYSGIIGNLLKCILFVLFSKWHPIIFFSIESFRSMFAFGSKLMISQIIDCIYSNIYPFAIGKRFSAGDVGYFTRGQAYAELPPSILRTMIMRVCYPVFCKELADKNKLVESYEKMLLNLSYITVLVMTLLFILAKPLVVILISEKWLPCVLFLKILCFSFIWFPMIEISTSFLKALGKSDLILKIQTLSKIIAIIILGITLNFDISIMCVGAAIISLMSLIINFHFCSKVIGKSILIQIKQIASPLFSGLGLIITGSFISLYIQNPIINMLVCGTVGSIVYIGIALCTGLSVIDYKKFSI